MRSSANAVQRSLRRMTLGAILALLVQSGFGVAVNLFETIPKHHSGANPVNYLSGSYRSVVWAMGHGAGSLVVHTVLGLILILMSISIVVRALSLKSTWIAAWSILGLLLILGAGFNGASSLDYNEDVSSLVMALLAFGSIACYAIMTYLLASFEWRHHYETS
jgi:hypothetical protein